MKNLWMKMVVMVAVAMSLSACGKSKDSSNVSEPVAKKEEPKKLPVETDNQGNGKGTGRKKNPAGQNGAVTPNKHDIIKIDADTQTMLNEAHKFSGGGDDYLRTLWEYKQSEVKDEAQKLRNLKLAYLVRSASLKVDYNETGDVAVTVVIGTSEKDQKTIMLGGTLYDSRETKLMMASDKKISASGKIRCMDKIDDGLNTCETAIVSLTVNKADIKIIFRRSNVHLDAKFANVKCKTQDCEDMYSVFRQTEAGLVDRMTISKAKLESFEVIQGRSAFRLVMITRHKEVMTVAGPLVNADVSPVTNIPADRTLKVEDLVDLRSMENYKTNMHQSLNDVRIVGNNGRGKINLLVKMKMSNDGIQDQFQLNLERLQREIEPTIEMVPARLSLE